MKNNNRISRINDEIMKELSQIIRSEVKLSFANMR